MYFRKLLTGVALMALPLSAFAANIGTCNFYYANGQYTAVPQIYGYNNQLPVSATTTASISVPTAIASNKTLLECISAPSTFRSCHSNGTYVLCGSSPSPTTLKITDGSAGYPWTDTCRVLDISGTKSTTTWVYSDVTQTVVLSYCTQ